MPDVNSRDALQRHSSVYVSSADLPTTLGTGFGISQLPPVDLVTFTEITCTKDVHILARQFLEVKIYLSVLFITLATEL